MTTRARRQQPDIEPRARPSAARTRYKPSVRSRTARDEPRTPLRPDFQRELSDTITYGILLSTATTTAVNLTVSGKINSLVRLIQFKLVQITSDGDKLVELYFGSASAMPSNSFLPIDYIKVTDGGEGSSRIYSRGVGPVGVNREISFRFTTAPTANTHYLILTYTTER